MLDHASRGHHESGGIVHDGTKGLRSGQRQFHRVGPVRPGHISQVFDGVHLGDASGAALAFALVAAAQLSNPSLDTTLTPLTGDGRPLSEWLTTFHLATVVLDPYTNESSWILETAARVLRHFNGASVRVNFLIACGADDARTFLGPLAEEFLVFCDPDRVFIKQLGLTELPAFVLVQMDGSVAASAQGWSAESWRSVTSTIAELTSWSKPPIPAPGDPGTFRGTPAVG